MAVSGGAAPLFILSFRHRDELTGMAERAGWQPIAARRAENAESRFIASGAQVAVVDARGALAEGRDAVRSLADPAEANAAGLLVLLSRTDEAALEELYAAGATHFLVSPFSEQKFLHAVQFARRHSERVGGRRPARRGDGVPSWRWRPGSQSVELSPALARKAGLGEEAGQRIGLMDLFRKLDPEGRKAARGAVDRLLATGEATAFAHKDAETEGRIAHHLRVEGGQGEIIGRTESIAPPEAGTSRDSMTGIRDAAAARAALSQALESGGPVILLLLAVSRFDTINAAFGRGVGDAVLQAAA
ncbi:MAG: bifunctional diguanylate cyclase/phosphodiesterase, partial [Alphaproteobacteria bacterium]|nr:bifunctional diguanylate cyclase/phosphodiesterase [Alphaproteobacteria bacterium]